MPKKKLIETFTVKHLIKSYACDESIRWFSRNYPKGLRITKRNIKKALEKLLKRRKNFLGCSIKGDDERVLEMKWDAEYVLGLLWIDQTDRAYSTDKAMYDITTKADIDKLVEIFVKHLNKIGYKL